jgi:hypothetical protein
MTKGLTARPSITFFTFFYGVFLPHASSRSENHGYVEKGKKEGKKELNPSAREVCGAGLLSCPVMKEGEKSETTSAVLFFQGRQIHCRVDRIDVAMSWST